MNLPSEWEEWSPGNYPNTILYGPEGDCFEYAAFDGFKKAGKAIVGMPLDSEVSILKHFGLKIKVRRIRKSPKKGW